MTERPALFLSVLGLLLVLLLGGAARGEEEAARPQVLLTTSVWTLPRDFMQTAFESVDEFAIHHLDDLDREVILRGIAKREGATVEHGPRLVVDSGDEGAVAVMEAVSYVREYDVELADDALIADPVIDTLDEGFTVSATPTVADDRRHLTLEIQVTFHRVERPIRKKEVRVEGLETPLSVDTPHVTTHETRATLRIPDGGTVALTGFPDPENPGCEQVLVLQAVILRDAEHEPPAPPATTTPDGPVISIEAKVLEIHRNVARRLLGDAVPTVQVPVRQLDARQVATLLRASAVSVLHAPSLLAYAGQRANLSVLNQIPYVQDFEVEKGEDGEVAVDPIVGTIQEGLILDVTASIAEDGKGLVLETEVTFAEVARPIPDFETVVEGRKVTIQLPEVHVLRVAEDIPLPAGGYALLALGGEKDVRRFVLLKAAVTRR